jgi:hypothetical protein
MPRSAATMLGLMLVAISIGFNTVRYPVVWEMVGPVRASESVQSAVASPSEKPDSPPQPSQPADPIEGKPTPEVADKVVAGDSLSVEGSPASGDRAVASEAEARKPLVPVTPVISANALGFGAAGGAGIRRLPPVVQTDLGAANRVSAQSFGRAIPVYPTTGIE